MLENLDNASKHQIRPKDIVIPLTPNSALLGRFSRGREYEVESLFYDSYDSSYYDGNFCCQKISVRGVEGSYDAKHFLVKELYNPNFKEGDRVRCVDASGCSIIHQ